MDIKSFLPKGDHVSRRRSKKVSKPKTETYKKRRPKRSTRPSRKGKLSPGLIKGMKALLKSTSPRVSAAMKAGIRRRLKQERVKV